MIKTFRCRDSETLFSSKRVARFVNFERAALRKLEQLDLAQVIEDMCVPPGNRLDALKGDRAGEWSMHINGQWRVCFRFEGGNALDVTIIEGQSCVKSPPYRPAKCRKKNCNYQG